MRTVHHWTQKSQKGQNWANIATPVRPNNGRNFLPTAPHDFYF